MVGEGDVKYEHIAILSDGTKLTQAQYAELQLKGVLEFNGKTLTFVPIEYPPDWPKNAPR